MSEKNFEVEKKSNKFEDYYHWLLNFFPDGNLGMENAIPITIGGNKMYLIIFEPTNNHVSFGLFLPGHKYARKTLMINEYGYISEDTRGIIPDFDRAECEPKIVSTNEQIVTAAVTAAMEIIKKRFSDN